MNKIIAWVKQPNGLLRIFIHAIQNFSAAQGTRYASSLAYYALFSLFPLVVVLIWAVSFFLEDRQVMLGLQRLAFDIVPVDNDIIRDNIERVMDLRGTIGVMGLLALLWSASEAFSVLVASINLAWKEARMRTFFQQRLLAFGMIVIIIVILLLLPLVNSISNLLPGLGLPFFEETIIASPAWILVANLITFVITFLALAALYRWVPKTKVSWRSAIWAAMIASAALLIFNRLFTFYLASGLSGYTVIYGSVGAIVALLTWIYLNSMILIFGAHLSAAISESRPKTLQ